MKVFPGTTSRETLWPRLGGGAAMLIAGRVTSAACGLIQVPFALAHLGNEAFGLWTALTGLLWSLGILDLGLGYALQNRLAPPPCQPSESPAQTCALQARDHLLQSKRRAMTMCPSRGPQDAC